MTISLLIAHFFVASFAVFVAVVHMRVTTPLHHVYISIQHVYKKPMIMHACFAILSQIAIVRSVYFFVSLLRNSMQTRPLYQQQKKEKSISIVTWALVTSWLVIFAGIWWVFYGQHSADTPEILPEVQLPSLDTTDTQEPIKQYYMGENILMQ
jgi:Na+/proline symporter